MKTKTDDRKPLTKKTFEKAIEVLCDADADLARVVDEHGTPDLWVRDPGFDTLTKIILEQQVSLAAANAVFARLTAAVDPFTPEQLLATSDDTLRKAGLSRQKLRYCKHLSTCIEDGTLSLDDLTSFSDAEAKEMLMQVKGIGKWSADIYLLVAERRPDVLPVGDLALVVAMKQLKRMRKMPSDDRFLRTARPWRPYRAVAARLLWHYYRCEIVGR